ncbi:MAG: stalk domain-containing protein [Bacillota bacterium]
MLKNLRVFVDGFITYALLMGFISAAFAAGDLSIKAVLSNTIKLKLNGKDWTPKDPVTGDYYRPIIYNGRTYLPVRAVSEAAGLPLDYDGAAKTIWIGGKSDVLQIKDTSHYEDEYGSIVTTDAAKLASPGGAYKWGITNKKDLSLDHFIFYLKPNGKYQRFRASFFLDEGVMAPLTVNIRKDDYNGAVIKSLVLTPGETLAGVDVETGGINRLCVEADVRINHDVVKKLIIGEPVFYNGTLPAESPVRG